MEHKHTGPEPGIDSTAPFRAPLVCGSFWGSGFGPPGLPVISWQSRTHLLRILHVVSTSITIERCDTFMNVSSVAILIYLKRAPLAVPIWRCCSGPKVIAFTCSRRNGEALVTFARICDERPFVLHPTVSQRHTTCHETASLSADRRLRYFR